MQHETIKSEFMQSFTDYGDAIFRFCLVKVSDKELAEDMTQEVFMRYWRYLREDKEMRNTRSFLYTIANNLAKDWYKKKKAVSLDDRLDAGLEPIATEAADPAISAEYNEVLQIIEDMDDRDRVVLLLRYVEGLPPKDIAEILEEKASTISVRIFRAEQRLKEKLTYG